MIVWINGAFGAGKTQTAFELHRRIPNSYVYDPENVGYFMRKNIPKEICQGDFQDYPMWRDFNFSMLHHVANHYDGVVIVPMTIVNPQYFYEIIGKLRDSGISVKHFTLCASQKTILHRLRSRREGANSWAAQQIDRCLDALAREVFVQHIDTEDMTIEEAATEIAALSNITALPSSKSSLKRNAYRFATKIRHIRQFSWRI